MDHLILVGLGGAAGSLCRFEISKIATIRGIPLGTALVNILGSLLFSLVAFSRSPGDLYYFIDVGVLGGFTTFSTFSFETFRMFEEQNYLVMTGNILINLLGSLGGVCAGYLVITGLGGGV
ncbi:fluoride efflux transporter FluC [Methanospirillum lacunae]|uniref:Fluoride-specific ion channel FluC n=1 Tax=Methanospirillum lacunae TaxID=668570 RepID=A0A2V2MW79_9EURY|nr:CrcB family protein [Methanospirillum lacunae]PWR71639.1 chromosome condensation protein CrcB [Methanospirillum lacunae]